MSQSYDMKVIEVVRSTYGLGREVYRLRRRAGFTQAALAAKAGVSRDWLIRLEQGHERLEAGKVLAVIDALGFEVSLVEKTARDTGSLEDLLARRGEDEESDSG